MARSFLLDWEEMSKAFSDLRALKHLKRKPPGELYRQATAQWGVCGWSHRGKVGWASVHSQGRGRVWGDDGRQWPEWEAEVIWL